LLRKTAPAELRSLAQALIMAMEVGSFLRMIQKFCMFVSATERYRFSPEHSMPRKRAPLVGEANVQVYQGEFGLNKAEFETLSRKGII
jgi:hypothetical protein